MKLTHKMLLQTCLGVITRFEDSKTGGKQSVGEWDTYISYLPAAHSFEQGNIAMVCFAGMRCGFYAGNTLKLVEDIGILKPTIFPSVPRLYNKIYGKIKDKLADKTGVGKWLVDKAVAAKLDRLKSGGGVTHAFYDALVFKKMRILLGGRVRIMLTGSAPISGDVLDFLKICFSSPIAEGYGMTETSAGSCVCYLDDPQTGIVGGPL